VLYKHNGVWTAVFICPRKLKMKERKRRKSPLRRQEERSAAVTGSYSA